LISRSAGVPDRERSAEVRFSEISHSVHQNFIMRRYILEMNPPISIPETFKRPCAILPILMSLSAVVVILVHLIRFGSAPQADEGGAAHVWQLLMGAQLPVVAFFLIRWTPKAPRAAFLVLAAQVAAALAALAPVYLLKW
jgi:hypothetical protein